MHVKPIKEVSKRQAPTTCSCTSRVTLLEVAHLGAVAQAERGELPGQRLEQRQAGVSEGVQAVQPQRAQLAQARQAAQLPVLRPPARRQVQLLQSRKPADGGPSVSGSSALALRLPQASPGCVSCESYTVGLLRRSAS